MPKRRTIAWPKVGSSFDVAPELEDRFAVAVDVGLSRITQQLELHPSIFGGVRRALLRTLPYAVYYRIQSLPIQVIAVLHTRRDPAAWQSRA